MVWLAAFLLLALATHALQVPKLQQQRHISESGFDITPWSAERTLAAAESVRGGLSALQRGILFDRQTELSYSGRFRGPAQESYRYNHKGDGIYCTVVGLLPLFDAKHRFVSGTGWPSFYAPFDMEHVAELIKPDLKGYTEIVCRRTGLHIGHRYNDTPPPSLLRELTAGSIMHNNLSFGRYCVNANALVFVSRDSAEYSALMDQRI